MPDRSHPNVYRRGSGLLAFIRRAICLEADSNVKREMRESFAKPGKTLDMGDWRVEVSHNISIWDVSVHSCCKFP
jgi:hypothetical protein